MPSKCREITHHEVVDLRTRIDFAYDKAFVDQVVPVDAVAARKRVSCWENNEHGLSPERLDFAARCRGAINYERGVHPKTANHADMVSWAALDNLQVYSRMSGDEGLQQFARGAARDRGYYAYPQSSFLTKTAAARVSYEMRHILH